MQFTVYMPTHPMVPTQHIIADLSRSTTHSSPQISSPSTVRRLTSIAPIHQTLGKQQLCLRPFVLAYASHLTRQPGLDAIRRFKTVSPNSLNCVACSCTCVSEAVFVHHGFVYSNETLQSPPIGAPTLLTTANAARPLAAAV